MSDLAPSAQLDPSSHVHVGQHSTVSASKVKVDAGGRTASPAEVANIKAVTGECRLHDVRHWLTSSFSPAANQNASPAVKAAHAAAIAKLEAAAKAQANAKKKAKAAAKAAPKAAPKAPASGSKSTPAAASGSTSGGSTVTSDLKSVVDDIF